MYILPKFIAKNKASDLKHKLIHHHHHPQSQTGVCFLHSPRRFFRGLEIFNFAEHTTLLLFILINVFLAQNTTWPSVIELVLCSSNTAHHDERRFSSPSCDSFSVPALLLDWLYHYTKLACFSFYRNCSCRWQRMDRYARPGFLALGHGWRESLISSTFIRPSTC
jgi:hypothetical protein